MAVPTAQVEVVQLSWMVFLHLSYLRVRAGRQPRGRVLPNTGSDS